jgi:hypothetical protein
MPPSRFSTAAEPMGLAPVEEEWPEPAQLKEDEGRAQYDLARGPIPWEETPPAPPPRDDAYELTDRLPDLPPPGPTPTEESYAVDAASASSAPQASALVDPKQVEELMREAPLTPPAHPLWSGIYAFPWRPENLGVWFYLGLNLSLLAIMATAMVALLNIGGAVTIGVPLLIPLMGLVFLWTGIYGAGCFLATVEDTAAGNDRVVWPQGGGLVDGLGRFLFVFWVAGCGGFPAVLFWLGNPGHAKPGDLEWILPLIPGVLLFPTVMLSALTADSWWMLLDIKIVFGLLRKPPALLLVSVPTMVLLLPCVFLGYSIVTRPNLLLAMGAGWVWSAFLLIYGRILGRTGWLLIRGRIKRRGGKKKGRVVKGAREEVGWG